MYEKEFVKYFDYESILSSSRDEYRDFQKYTRSPQGYPNTEAILVLSDIFEQTEKKLIVYFELINRKTNEISSSRVTLTNIILSLAAIVVALISIA